MGGNAPICSYNVKQKYKNTMLQRYNVEYTIQNIQLRKKQQNTCLKKYGTKYAIQSDIVKLNIKHTIKQKYGTQHITQNKIIQQKIQNTCNNKYGFKTYSIYQGWLKINSEYWKQFVIPLFTKQQYKGYNKIYKWKCVQCGIEFQQKIYTTHFNQQCDILPRCPHCYPKYQAYSKQQKQLAEFCKQYFPQLYQNNYQLISPYQVDIFIKQLNLALQFNGSYWHQLKTQSNKYGVESGYHLMKTRLCNQKNIRLIHIWQDQWTNNKQQIKQKLIKIFKNQQIIPTNELLDFSWFNNIDLNKYILKQQNQPILKQRNNFLVQNCGSIILQENIINEKI